MERFRPDFASDDGRRRLGWFLNDSAAADVLADDDRLRRFYTSWFAEHGDEATPPDPAVQRKAALGTGLLLLVIGLFVLIGAAGATAASSTTAGNGPCERKPYFDSAVHCSTASAPEHDTNWGILVGGAAVGGTVAVAGLVLMLRHPLLRL